MNWGFIAWVAGIAFTLYLTRFVLDLLKGLFGKDSRQRVIKGIGDSCSEAHGKMSDYLNQKLEKRRMKKTAEKETLPSVRVL